MEVEARRSDEVKGVSERLPENSDDMSRGWSE